MRHQVFEADRDQHAVDRLARPVLLQQVEEREPALLVGLGVEILRRVAAGGVDQHRVLGEPPVAVARAADAGDRRRRCAARQRKLQPGIHQRGGLAGAGRADQQVPGQIVEIVALAAARLLQRRERVLHLVLEDDRVAFGRSAAAPMPSASCSADFLRR